MNNCSNLLYLSAIACQLSECLSAEALAILSSDLVVLSDMLANLIERKDSYTSLFMGHHITFKKNKESIKNTMFYNTFLKVC